MDNNKNSLKKKRSLFFPVFRFTICLILIGLSISHVVPSTITKKEKYVNLAKSLMDSVETFVERDNIKVKDTTATYYIPVSCVNFNENIETPYGELDQAYVIVTYSGSGYRYYWISKDTSNFGVPTIKSYKELTADDIKSNVFMKKM